ncbi:MAG TPA: DUF2474 family protein [Steroidobacteraceae bacterium]|nr:DUF2474 family protein [Steroidobacteraceae bacterium]
MPDAPLHKRLLWLIGIWAAGVLALGLVSALLRWLLRPR